MRVLRLVWAPALLFGIAAGAACGDGGETTYDVTVNFNESVTQADMDETADFLRRFDGGLDFLIMELFPPIGRAEVNTDASGFCEGVEFELGGKSYVRDVACEPVH